MSLFELIMAFCALLTCFFIYTNANEILAKMDFLNLIEQVIGELRQEIIRLF